MMVNFSSRMLKSRSAKERLYQNTHVFYLKFTTRFFNMQSKSGKLGEITNLAAAFLLKQGSPSYYKDNN